MVEWTVVLQLCRSGRISWADMVLAPSVAGLFKWRQFEPEMIYWRWTGTCVFHCRTVTSRNSLLSADFWSTTSPSGGGSNVTRRKFSADCDRGSDRPTTVGGWTRPTSGSRANGCIYTGLSTPAVRRSTSFCRLNATQQRLSAFSQRLWDRHEISVSSYATIRTNCIVPFSVERVGTNIYLCDLLF